MTLHRAGRFEDAQAAYRTVLEREPENADVLHLLGLIAYQTGKFPVAAEFIDRAIAIRPDEAKFHSNRGNVAKAMGDGDGAEQAYMRALDHDPGFADARFNLGVLLQERGDLPAAARTYHTLLLAAPDYTDAISNLGVANLGLGRLDEAASLFDKLIRSGAETAEAWLNLGSVRERQRRIEDSITALEKALALKPDYAEAKSLLRHHYLEVCAWKPLARLIGTIDEKAPRSNQDSRTAELPFSSLVSSEDPALNLYVARSWAEHLQAHYPPMFDRSRRSRAASDSRLTIGYLSCDIHDHPTAHLMRGQFAAHDHHRFRINMYSYGGDDGSDYRKQIAAACDSFVDIREMGHAAAARRIHDDGVDILVDLKGWTQGNRLAICAHRPAPVQATYIGFPGTSGAEFFDYAVVDRFVVPDFETRLYTEALAYMPHCYQANDDRQEIAGEPLSRADAGLPEEGFVFCCFNRPLKFDPVMFGLWMEVLRAVEGSVLWLFAGNDRAPVNLRIAAEEHGIDPARLVFAGRWPKTRHLRRIQLADLALDTRVCNGHTTTSDTLWAGVPVVAMEGTHFASRVSASCLRAVGLPELIAPSPEAFVGLAVGLARDPAALAALKAKLWKNRTREPLFDTARFTRDLESLFLAMWERHEKGLPPAALEVPEPGPAS